MSFCNLAQLILPILDENADTTAHDWMGASAREMLAELLLELNRPSEALRSTKQLCVSLRIGLTLSMERRVLSPRRAKQTMPRPVIRRIETRDGPHSAPPFENARLLGSLVRQNPPSLSVAEEATAAGAASQGGHFSGGGMHGGGPSGRSFSGPGMHSPMGPRLQSRLRRQIQLGASLGAFVVQ
jgi:hypothetical protein